VATPRVVKSTVLEQKIGVLYEKGEKKGLLGADVGEKKRKLRCSLQQEFPRNKKKYWVRKMKRAVIRIRGEEKKGGHNKKTGRGTGEKKNIAQSKGKKVSGKTKSGGVCQSGPEGQTSR